MTGLPHGTVTFLMTDVESSTELWHRHGARMDDALVSLDRDIRDAVALHGGVVIKARGEGDSHFAAFHQATGAIGAAIDLQRGRAEVAWPRVRIALHTGEIEPRDVDYLGELVNRTARLRGAAHGGQIICSRVVAELAAELDKVDLRSLGTHRVRDIPTPVELFQICSPGLPAEFPPLVTAGTTASTVMTVVVADRVGSSKIARDPDAKLVDWQGPLLRALRTEANANHGRFLKLLGDGCFVAFEDPRAAIAFTDAICGDPSLHVRAAISAGVVEVIEGELSGAPLFEVARQVKSLEAGSVWVAPVVEALVPR